MSSATQPSSLRLTRDAIRWTWNNYVDLFRRGWSILIPLHLAQVTANQFFAYCTEYLRQTGREDVSFIAIIAGLELLFTLMWSAAWILAIAVLAQSQAEQSAPTRVPFGHALEPVREPPRPPFLTLMHRYFNPVMIEQVRGLAAVLWRVPLLIVPALVQYVRLTLVPLIVVLNPEYEGGRVDALRESRQMSRGHFWLLALTVVLSMAIPWFFEDIAQGDAGPWIWANPIRVILASTLTLFINVGTSVFLFALFRGLFQVLPRQGWTDDATAPLQLGTS